MLCCKTEARVNWVRKSTLAMQAKNLTRRIKANLTVGTGDSLLRFMRLTTIAVGNGTSLAIQFVIISWQRMSSCPLSAPGFLYETFRSSA